MTRSTFDYQYTRVYQSAEGRGRVYVSIISIAAREHGLTRHQRLEVVHLIRCAMMAQACMADDPSGYRTAMGTISGSVRRGETGLEGLRYGSPDDFMDSLVRVLDCCTWWKSLPFALLQTV